MGKDPNAGEDCRQEDKGATEDEMVGQHLNEHEFEQTLRDSGGQGSLVCCSSWGHKQPVTTHGLNNNSNHSVLQWHLLGQSPETLMSLGDNHYVQ